MPVPGPRHQWGPDPGYNNPWGEDSDRINLWLRPGPVMFSGRTPGTIFHQLRGNMLGAGQVRRLWRQTVDIIFPGEPFSWTDSAPGAGGSEPGPRGFHITRALRYMTRSLYMGEGQDNTRYSELHTVVHPSVRSKTVTSGAGQRRNPPTIRNRLTSFGSRVPPANAKVPAAQ